MSSTDRGLDLLDDTVECVEGASDLDEALVNMVRVLTPRFDLTVASVSLYGEDTATLCAHWQAVPGAFEAGMTISTNLTDGMRELSSKLRATGLPLIVHADQTDLGLISDMIRREGIRSGVMIPLWRDGDVVGVLVFAGATPAAFGEQALPLFTGIGRGVEERILKLAAAK